MSARGESDAPATAAGWRFTRAARTMAGDPDPADAGPGGMWTLEAVR